MMSRLVTESIAGMKLTTKCDCIGDLKEAKVRRVWNESIICS
jgi:hypothetical protein